MIIKDNFSKFTNISKFSGCIAFFTNEKPESNHLKKYLSSLDYKNLKYTLKFLANLKNETEETFSTITTNNFFKLFNINL